MCGQPPNHRQNASAEREREKERKRDRERLRERERERDRQLDGRKQLCQRLLQLQRHRLFVCLEIIRGWFHHQLTALAANRFCNRC